METGVCRVDGGVLDTITIYLADVEIILDFPDLAWDYVIRHTPDSVSLCVTLLTCS